MIKNCFTCKHATGCPYTWKCYDNPYEFDSDLEGCHYEPYNNEDDETNE